jgi:hypothetical protein
MIAGLKCWSGNNTTKKIFACSIELFKNLAEGIKKEPSWNGYIVAFRNPAIRMRLFLEERAF